ncbi:unnamed protein product [Notodromas monacha]|uniref:Uncharacterized protein n=1 Tax=Notodromas monacha TaxID=399045 RepID=A0A7R9BRI1_9CRUS|nr:unnamed protein product [Notodromas monacha]CAG0918838.1 unnamed protein product [Notodromas monacha]
MCDKTQSSNCPPHVSQSDDAFDSASRVGFDPAQASVTSVVEILQSQLSRREGEVLQLQREVEYVIDSNNHMAEPASKTSNIKTPANLSQRSIVIISIISISCAAAGDMNSLRSAASQFLSGIAVGGAFLTGCAVSFLAIDAILTAAFPNGRFHVHPAAVLDRIRRTTGSIVIISVIISISCAAAGDMNSLRSAASQFLSGIAVGGAFLTGCAVSFLAIDAILTAAFPNGRFHVHPAAVLDRIRRYSIYISTCVLFCLRKKPGLERDRGDRRASAVVVAAATRGHPHQRRDGSSDRVPMDLSDPVVRAVVEEVIDQVVAQIEEALVWATT